MSVQHSILIGAAIIGIGIFGSHLVAVRIDRDQLAGLAELCKTDAQREIDYQYQKILRPNK